jgi:hypothetical protein
MSQTRNNFEDWWQAFLTTLKAIGGVAVFSLVVSILAAIALAVAIFIGGFVFSDSGFSVDPKFTSFVKVIAWPLVALVTLIAFFVSRESRVAISGLLSRITNIKAGTYEVNFSVSGAQKLKRDIEQSLNEFAGQGRIEYDRAARTYTIRDHLESVVRAIIDISKELEIPSKDGIDLKNVRVAVHMQDVVFEESLYQLTDYYPKGGGRGRRFSSRYGAIGLAWREEKSQHWNMNDPQNNVVELIRRWGMTEAEANHSQTYEAGFCVILRDESGQRCGMLYVDTRSIQSITSEKTSVPQNADMQRIIEKLQGSKSLLNLARSVRRVYEIVARSGTFIGIYE